MSASKNIQISYGLFIYICQIFALIDENALQGEALELFQRANKGVLEKRASIRNREAYTALKQAQTEDERELALGNYLNTKKLPISF